MINTLQNDFVLQTSLLFYKDFSVNIHYQLQSEKPSDFKSFIESLPPQITFDETATKDKQSAKNDVEKFANADEDSLEIFKEAKALSEKENISFRDALLKLDI